MDGPAILELEVLRKRQETLKRRRDELERRLDDVNKAILANSNREKQLLGEMTLTLNSSGNSMGMTTMSPSTGFSRSTLTPTSLKNNLYTTAGGYNEPSTYPTQTQSQTSSQQQQQLLQLQSLQQKLNELGSISPMIDRRHQQQHSHNPQTNQNILDGPLLSNASPKGFYQGDSSSNNSRGPSSIKDILSTMTSTHNPTHNHPHAQSTNIWR